MVKKNIEYADVNSASMQKIFDPESTHLIFTDLQMHEINGVMWDQLISQNTNRNAYIYCVTGDNNQKIDDLKSSNLFLDVFSKPIKMDLMKEVLSQHCQLVPPVHSKDNAYQGKAKVDLCKIQEESKSIDEPSFQNIINSSHDIYGYNNHNVSQISIRSQRHHESINNQNND
ncbi:hypothetical protein N9Y17_01980 [Gammaproteobacteria bacterium]|nr:hypothetical protein [Gammaproteobacteria bacterium]